MLIICNEKSVKNNKYQYPQTKHPVEIIFIVVSKFAFLKSFHSLGLFKYPQQSQVVGSSFLIAAAIVLWRHYYWKPISFVAFSSSALLCAIHRQQIEMRHCSYILEKEQSIHCKYSWVIVTCIFASKWSVKGSYIITWHVTTLGTSNGSWRMGIKGEMSGTVCVTFTWDMYIYIWVVYSLCFFCCLFTWWYVWCIDWASGNQEEVQACLVTLWLFIMSC